MTGSHQNGIRIIKIVGKTFLAIDKHCSGINANVKKVEV